MKKILLLIPCLFLLSGCYDMKEISDELYAIILAVDKTDEGIKLSVAVPIYASTEENSATTFSVEAEDISLGLDKLDRFVPRRISLLHLKTVIFSEELAESGLFKHTESIQKHMETTNAMGVMVSRCPAEELLKQMCEQTSGNIASETELLMLSGRYNTFYPKVLFEDFYNDMKSVYRSASAPLSDTGDEIMCGTALFSGDIMTGVLNKDESVFCLVASGKLSGVTLTFDTESGRLPVELKCKGSKIRADDHISITAELEGRTEQMTDLAYVEKEIERDIKNGIVSVIRKSAGLGCDVLGLKGYSAKNHMLINTWEKDSVDYENIVAEVNLKLSESVNG